MWKDYLYKSMSSAKKQSDATTNMNRLSTKWATNSSRFSAKTLLHKVKILLVVKANQKNGSSNRPQMIMYKLKHLGKMGGTTRY